VLNPRDRFFKKILRTDFIFMKKITFLLLFLGLACNCSKQNFLNFGQNSSKNNLLNLDEWAGDGYSGFSDYKKVVGKRYMIATSEKLASVAGEKILAQGGNAVDAAIAAQMVLNVVEPHSSGIGGGLFLLYYNNKTKSSEFFNGRETAPAAAFPEIFLDKSQKKARKFEDIVGGGLSVGTPGALYALFEAHKKYGKLPWKKLFEPAIRIAEDGFIVSKKIETALNQVQYLPEFEGMKIYFDHSGKPIKAGSFIKNYQLAKTFKIIAKQGIKPFYNGKIARDIVKTVQNSKKNPGFLSLDDLKNYRSSRGKLVCDTYRQKYKICSMPLPSSGGTTILQILGILENFDLAAIPINSAPMIHLVAESTRLAYCDRNEYLADIAEVPIKSMLDKVYLQERAKLINPEKAFEKAVPGDFSSSKNHIKTNTKFKIENFEAPSTTHLSIIDSYGNAVALTSSIEYMFGSALMVDGFMLNNQLTDFSLVPEINGKPVANRVEPKKQPRSSMSPTFVFDKNDKLLMVVGSPGGPRIIQFVVKALIGVLDYGLDIQEAISLPNFVVLNDIIELENRTKLDGEKRALEKMGHKVKITDITSAIQAVLLQNNQLQGGADPRRQGAAIGK